MLDCLTNTTAEAVRNLIHTAAMAMFVAFDCINCRVCKCHQSLRTCASLQVVVCQLRASCSSVGMLLPRPGKLVVDLLTCRVPEKLPAAP